MCDQCKDDIDQSFHCADCGMWTGTEYYMVHDFLWRIVGSQRTRMFCIGCFERRLGRKLRRTDFTDALVNRVEYQPKSLRLMERLGYV